MIRVIFLLLFMNVAQYQTAIAAGLKIEIIQPILTDDLTLSVQSKDLEIQGRITPATDLAFAMLNDMKLEVDADGIFKTSVVLKPGLNEFFLGAASKQGENSFLSFTITYEESKAQGLPAIPPTPTQDVSDVIVHGELPEIFALIVGVSDFINDPTLNLKFAAKDAMEYYQFVRSPQGGNVPESNIKLLMNEKATKLNILKELKDILTYADEDDIFLFYYSGHGQGVGNNKKFCLYPHEINTTSIDDIEITGVTQDELMNRIYEGRPGKKLMFIDACHSGLLASDGQKGIGNVASTLMKSMADADNTLTILTSSSDNEVSFEDEQLSGGHGIFTYYLIEGMQGEADRTEDGNGDGFVTVFELYQYLGQRTNQRSKKITGLPQRPDKRCVQCNDFPLSIAGDYDIAKSNVNVPVSTQKQVQPAVAVSQETASGTHQSEADSGKHPDGYTIIQREPQAKIEYMPPAKEKDLRGVVYSAETGQKITFYGQVGDDFYFSIWSNGEIITTAGHLLGSTIEFLDSQSRVPVKKGYMLFLDSQRKQMRLTMEFENGQKTDIVLNQLGIAKRKQLKDQNFVNANSDIELKVYALVGDDVYLSGHIGNRIILARGVIKGDAIEVVDNSKEWKSTGLIMLNDDWSAMRLQIQFENDSYIEYDVTASGNTKLRKLDALTYANANSSQTLTFDAQVGDDVKFAGVIGKDHLKGACVIRGDVLEVIDGVNDTVFSPTRFLLRNNATLIDIEIYFVDGNGVKVSLPLRK